MSELECPGLPAHWLNGWLAAVGATVLVPEMRLSWTQGRSPRAVFSTNGTVDPVEALASAWPSLRRVQDMPISKERSGCAELTRRPLLESFIERAQLARSHRDGWTLSSTLTDLYVTDSNSATAEAKHSKLDPAGPGTIGTLHDRLVKVLGYSQNDVRTSIEATTKGIASRVDTNGLGFDAMRITALGDKSKPRVDPVVEALAFFGLALFPVRGDGVSADRLRIAERIALRQRNWHLVDEGRLRRMYWPAWDSWLGRFGIDALLDAWRPQDRRGWHLLGVHAGWASVEYNPRGTADTTRGIGSEALA